MSWRLDNLSRERTFMKVFTLDAENDVTVFASLKEMKHPGRTVEVFCSERELAVLLEKSPVARLVEIWSGLPGVKPVRKFTSRAVAARRIWAAIQHLQPDVGPPARTVALKGVRAKTPPQKATRAPESKATLVVALLRDSKGATLQHIMRATGWQAHSVRGFIAGHVKKKLGLKVQSFKRDGERVYALKG
jgi:hypothetical protein